MAETYYCLYFKVISLGIVLMVQSKDAPEEVIYDLNSEMVYMVCQVLMSNCTPWKIIEVITYQCHLHKYSFEQKKPPWWNHSLHCGQKPCKLYTIVYKQNASHGKLIIKLLFHCVISCALCYKSGFLQTFTYVLLHGQNAIFMLRLSDVTLVFGGL